MFRTAARVKVKDVSRPKLVGSLDIVGGCMDVSDPMSPAEIELLKQIRCEMRQCETQVLQDIENDLDWTECGVAATILFNLAVSANHSPSLALNRRSYAALKKVIASGDDLLAVKSQVLKARLQLFSFTAPHRADKENTAHELVVQADLFAALHATKAISKRKRLFARVYTLASCMSEYLGGKSYGALYTRWETLTTTARRYREREKVEVRETVHVQHDQAQELSPEEYSANRGAPPATDLLPFSGSLDDVPAVAQRDDAVPPQDATPSRATAPPVFTDASSLALSTSRFTIIREEDLAMLSKEAASIGRAPGKWNHLHGLFTSLYPSSTLSLNALQCRVKQFQAKKARFDPQSSQPVAHAPVIVTVGAVETKKRANPTTSCTSCARRHKKCGRDGDTACLNTKKARTNAGTIQGFFG